MLKQFCSDYFSRTKSALDTVDLASLESVIEWMLEAHQQEKQIFVFGNGGSAAAASHFVCDVNKGVSMKLEKKFRMICLNDNIPTMLAYANDVSYEEVFVGQLRNFVAPGDVVIGISGSGNSPNVLRAIEYARSKGARTVGITGFNGGKLAATADLSVIARVADMQHVEDVQTVLTHVIMRALTHRLTPKEAPC